MIHLNRPCSLPSSPCLSLPLSLFPPDAEMQKQGKLKAKIQDPNSLSLISGKHPREPIASATVRRSRLLASIQVQISRLRRRGAQLSRLFRRILDGIDFWSSQGLREFLLSRDFHSSVPLIGFEGAHSFLFCEKYYQKRPLYPPGLPTIICIKRIARGRASTHTWRTPWTYYSS